MLPATIAMGQAHKMAPITKPVQPAGAAAM